MVLSVGMIVKDEGRVLAACLDGIRPILERVDSELIIADTGSADDTISIAKQYTDNVYSIEWRNDFAWARNTVIERTRGVWYMSLDADEIFQDVSDIVDFFNSGEYKGFNSASHLLRDAGADGYVSTVVRLFKKDADCFYTGRIHEYIPYKQPVKALGSVSLHTGYDGEGRFEEKAGRNLPVLLEMHGENPADLRIIGKITDLLIGLGDFDAARIYLDKGLCGGGSGIIPDSLLYHSLLQKNIYWYFFQDRLKEAAAETAAYFDKASKLFAFSINLRILEGNIAVRLGDYEKAAFSYTESAKLYGAYAAGKLDTADITGAFTPEIPPGKRGYALDCAAYAIYELADKNPLSAANALYSLAAIDPANPKITALLDKIAKR